MNTAGRILSICDRLTGGARGNDVSMVKVWAEVFELAPDSPSIEDDVVTCLQAMRSEIELLRSKLTAMGAPEDLMQPGIDRLRNVTSTAYIHVGWGSLRDEASKPENRLAFMWANWVLRSEDEDDMPTDELATLRGELDSLEASLLSTDMTPYIQWQERMRSKSLALKSNIRRHPSQQKPCLSIQVRSSRRPQR